MSNMKPKILITIEGGVIQSIGSNMDVDIVINDYDNEEEDQIYQYALDTVFKDGEAHKLIEPNGYPLSMAEQLAKEYLKELNY